MQNGSLVEEIVYTNDFFSRGTRSSTTSA